MNCFNSTYSSLSRLWSKVSEAIKRDDMDTATDEKTRIEDKQREDSKRREASNKEFESKFFNLVHGDQYEFKGIST